MRAIIHTAFGHPDDVLRLEEIPRPPIGADQVLVRVKAVGVGKGSWLTTHGLPYIARPAYGMRRPRRSVAGLEFSGIVTETGREVSALAPGDPVFGTSGGALAEFVAVSERDVAVMPANISFEQAAAAPVSGLVALQALRDGAAVRPGDRVLVVGASGSVGSFAVQIAKALGADVTGVASTRNVDRVRALGADQVIDYTKEEITDGGARFDAIVDIAGNRPLATLRQALTPRGTLVIVGGTGGQWTMGFGRTIRAMMLSPFVPQRLVGLVSTPTQADLQELARLMASDRVSPVVAATVPLPEAAEAIARAGTGHGHGTQVVRV